MKINKEWHLEHTMPKRATFDQRVEWHTEHLKHCSCRKDFPKKLKEEMVKTQHKLSLLCFAVLLFASNSFGQIRFIKTLHSGDNNWIYSYKKNMVEKNGCYYIPVINESKHGIEKDRFYILKLDNKGNIVSRKFYEGEENGRCSIFEASNNTMWRLTIPTDSVQHNQYFRFHLLDSNLNEMATTKVPRCFPSKCALGNEERFYLKLKDGGSIFILDVSAFGWWPFDNQEVYGYNFVHISKDGKLIGNTASNSFRAAGNNEIWQLSDTSFMMICYINGCKENCLVAKTFNMQSVELASKPIPKNIGTFKKCGNRFYAIKEYLDGYKSFICFNQNFDSLYEKPIPSDITYINFMDNGDNNDFRIRIARCEPDLSASEDCYQSLMDTTFAQQKIKWFSDDGQDELDEELLYDYQFYATKDGGGFFVFIQKRTPDDEELVFVKADTVYKWFSYIYSEKDNNIIYPNPNSQNRLFLEKDNWETLSIYDLTGRELLYYENPLYNLMDGIDIEDLRPGNYFLRIKLPNKTVYNKFIRY